MVKSLLFTSDRGGTPQIYKLNIATKRTERLTFTGNYNARPSLAPDGRTLAMVHRDTDTFHIASFDLKTGRMIELTRHDWMNPQQLRLMGLCLCMPPSRAIGEFWRLYRWMPGCVMCCPRVSVMLESRRGRHFYAKILFKLFIFKLLILNPIYLNLCSTGVKHESNHLSNLVLVHCSLRRFLQVVAVIQLLKSSQLQQISKTHQYRLARLIPQRLRMWPLRL